MRMTAKVGLVAAAAVFAGAAMAAASGRTRQSAARSDDKHETIATRPQAALRTAGPRFKVYLVPTGLASSDASQLSPAQRTLKVRVMLTPTGGGESTTGLAAPRTVRAKVMLFPTGTRSQSVNANEAPATMSPATITKGAQP